MPILSEDLKVCKQCEISKPVSEFAVKTYRTNRRDWVHARCKSCSRDYHLAHYYKDHAKNAETSRVKNNSRNARNKELVFAAYGGFKCNCCGVTERSFLTIDHVNNDGAAWRREKFKFAHAGGGHTYAWLVRNKFPAGFQVLCMNCQFGKRFNDGICPHQVTSNDYPHGE